ncbi:neural cell adhesion molecule 1-like, partial [Clupea harengus]|uniref:Neural cell adhesion molecule 1-like n=1 Tax=Clupea harengus TaxID=7950 RepID=A0A8M1KK42_CLUHA
MPAQGEISVGEGKFFLCEVVAGAKEIDWFSPSGEKIEPNRPDITVTRTDETTSTLTLYSATLDDAGTYKCVARRGSEEGEATVNVKIFQKIHVSSTRRRPRSLTRETTPSSCVTCSARPPPTSYGNTKEPRFRGEGRGFIYSYFMFNMALWAEVRFKVLPNNHLQIRGIKKTDEGTYTCEARIMARGEIDLRPIRVVIN